MIDSKGIVLKGKVTIKGKLITTSGVPESVLRLSLVANDAKPICEICEQMKNKKADA
ncbi:type IV secretion protein Rhs [Rodentibacter caecimuris]|uniref:Type IV secretion protein Rhs n=1 Tax=Rodentibacter caecimuris TaxID=1796644 RepID=A0ABX3KYG5_9PAST|nr:type IV secretion protein Rhs [Rodentibacter heylii]